MSTEVALTESKSLRSDYITAVPNAAYQIPGLSFPRAFRRHLGSSFDKVDCVP